MLKKEREQAESKIAVFFSSCLKIKAVTAIRELFFAKENQK